MRLPNGYGSVFKLSGNRRRPFAVRVNIGTTNAGSPKYKYIGYFEKQSEALTFLSKYNEGLASHANVLKADILFKEVFWEWLEEKEKYQNVGFKARESYICAFNQLSELHNRRFSLLRVDDLQGQIDKLEGMSESTIGKPITLFRFMYKFAMKKEYIDRDYSQYIIRVSAKEKRQIHKAFSREEIECLWNDNSVIAKQLLIYIYTGFRANELLEMKKERINISEKYMTGGNKTAAGKDRIVPIHKKILPLVKEFYNKENEYFFEENGKPISYAHFKDYHVRPFLKEKGMKHTMHDTRHTCASLLKEFGCDDFYRKLILGHHISDLTDRVYTHVTINRLLLEVVIRKFTCS